MKELLIIFGLVCGLFSCQSLEEKQKNLDTKRNQEKILQISQKEERAILEKKRIKQKILSIKQEEDDRENRSQLLGNSLLEETALLNKNALDLLSEKSQTTSISGEYDLLSDSSLTKFVNNVISFTDLKYVPENLVALEGEYIEDAKGGSKLRKEGLDALDDLAQNFYLKFSSTLKVVSAYRSYEYQKGIKDRGCPDELCAKAGYSEHQGGLAIDLWETSTQKRFQDDETLKSYFEWMNKEAYKYGFINTYQKGLEVDGYDVEPWHWRFVGIDLALILKEYKITFAEYMKSPENY